MNSASTHLDVAAGEDRLMRYLSIEGVTGQEKQIASAIRDDLLALGMPESSIRFDNVAERIPLPTETGNLIVDMPGARSEPRCCSPRISTQSRSAPVPSPDARVIA